MEDASPARLYATLLGAALLCFGVLGFAYSASFGTPGTVDEAVGAFAVNGWLNALHVLTGALGLLLAGPSQRGYALAMGCLYTALAIWGFALDAGDSIAGLLPANGGENLLHLALGLLGLLAAAGTPRHTSPARPPRRASS